jgi:Ca2+-binding RTX toxin-like protein
MFELTRITRVAGGIATATAAGLAFTALPAQAAAFTAPPAQAAATTARPAKADATATARVTAPGRVRYDAAKGQANNLLITAQGQVVTFDDDVAITAGTGCAPIAGDPTRVTCDLGAPAIALGLVVNLGDGADLAVDDTAVGMLASGGAGDDTLIGSDTAADHLRGEAGADSVQGRGGDNTVSGGPGNDQVWGGPGKDVLDGGSGDDVLYGDDGDDLMRGGDGNDLLIGGFGADVHDGGAGRDEANYAERSTGIVADLDNARGDDGEPGEGDSLLNIEDITGTSADDVLTGNDGDNSLLGGSGHDTIAGLGGDDYLDGGLSEYDGPDALDGGANSTPAGDTCHLSLSGGTTVNCETVTDGEA